MNYITKLKSLKKYKVNVPVDARKTQNTLTRKDKYNISRTFNKFKPVLNAFYQKKHVGQKTAKIMGSYGILTQNNNIFIAKNGSDKNELIKLTVRKKNGKVLVTRKYQDNKTTISHYLIDKTDFFSYAQQRFENLPPYQSLTIQIGNSSAWRNRNFGTFNSMLNYLPDFYAMVAKRDNKTPSEAQQLIEPIITLVDFSEV